MILGNRSEKGVIDVAGNLMRKEIRSVAAEKRTDAPDGIVIRPLFDRHFNHLRHQPELLGLIDLFIDLTAASGKQRFAIQRRIFSSEERFVNGKVDGIAELGHDLNRQGTALFLREKQCLLPQDLHHFFFVDLYFCFREHHRPIG